MKKIMQSMLFTFLFVGGSAIAEQLNVLQLVDCPNGNSDKNAIWLGIEDEEYRIISSRGDTQLIVAPAGSEIKQSKEVKRRSQIAEDLQNLVTLGTLINDMKKGANAPKCYQYRQSYKRATLQITSAPATDKTANHVIKVGPKEHLYMSVDLPVTKITQLQYNQDTGTITEKDKPASFYFSANWKRGDVFEQYDSDEWTNNISYKVMLKASKRPTESYGLGLGYQFEAVELFIAHIWTRADDSETVDLDEGEATVFGVSFNLTKGIAWLKGK